MHQESLRYPIDIHLAGLSGNISSGWLVHEEAREPDPSPKNKTTYCIFVWTSKGLSHSSFSKDVRYQAGHLTIIPPGTFTTHIPQPDNPCHLRYIALEGPIIERWLRALPSNSLTAGEARVIKSSGLEQVMLQLTNPERLQNDPCGWSWTSTLHELLGMLDALFRHDCEDMCSMQVRSLVDTDPAYPWSLTTIAAELGLTERTLSRSFRQQTQLSVMQWVRQRRMQLAKGMLANGHSVTATAEAIGAANPYSFSRCFKSVMGISEVTAE